MEYTSFEPKAEMLGWRGQICRPRRCTLLRGKEIRPEVQKAEDTIVARQALASKLNCAEGRLFIHYGLLIFWYNRLSEANHRTDH